MAKRTRVILLENIPHILNFELKKSKNKKTCTLSHTVII